MQEIQHGNGQGQQDIQREYKLLHNQFFAS
jgi:hypothetical protein